MPSRIMLPAMSAGMRSGVNWMREYLSCIVRARVRSSVVLPRPGTPSSRTMSTGEQADEHAFDDVVLADDDFGNFPAYGA